MNSTPIYILDDNIGMCELLTDMVEDMGLNAACFTSGFEFFNEIINFPKNSLMILDLSMPEMDGIEVMRRLAKMLNPPQLILISGHDIGVLHSAVKLGREHKLNIISSLDKPIIMVNFQKLLLKYFRSLIEIKVDKLVELECLLEPEKILEAINNEEMILYFQPQIEIKTGRVISCEALVRWLHPEMGLIYPDSFISIIEEKGWMSELTTWVLKSAIIQSSQWNKLNVDMPISINVSANNISSLQLPEQISQLLNDYKVKPNLLSLEVTESALMGELITSLDILTRIRLKGIGLSIDDFGTGYSSLSKLHKIPFNELKIDQSFVKSMLEDDEARAIVKTCIMLGHELKMNVVAEGVETIQHFELLKGMGCDIAQGYYFCKPVPAAEMLEFMTKVTD